MRSRGPKRAGKSTNEPSGSLAGPLNREGGACAVTRARARATFQASAGNPAQGLYSLIKRRMRAEQPGQPGLAPAAGDAEGLQ